ncbi:DUF6873 family GME fold protein [Caldicellulosiruptoraceae bacterium PP1]
MNFVKFPHSPSSKVKYVLIDERAYNKTFYVLEENNITPIIVNKSQDVHESISSHPDIFYFPFQDDIIITAPNAPKKTTQKLIDIGVNIIFGNKALQSKYPNDCAYNIARINDYIIHNLEITDKIVLEYIKKVNLKTISVNQGYTKCSILIIEKNAIITSDKGIAKKTLNNGIDTLLIKPGFIELFNLNYGFIGGCAGFIDKDLLLFNGDISKHPDFQEIKMFLKKYKKDLVYTPNYKLQDIGSIIPVIQD